MPGENVMGQEGLEDAKIIAAARKNLDYSEGILDALNGKQQETTGFILKSIPNNLTLTYSRKVELTKTGLIKIYIFPNALSSNEKKSPITIVVKKDGSVNVRIDQHQYYYEFYYMHLNTDHTVAVSYIEGFSEILQGKSPDEIFGKGNHKLEKKEYNVPSGDINYYHEGKHMPTGFKSKNKRFNSGEFDTKK